MAVDVKKTDSGYEITLSNGHSEALKKITTDYNIIFEFLIVV